MAVHYTAEPNLGNDTFIPALDDRRGTTELATFNQPYCIPNHGQSYMQEAHAPSVTDINHLVMAASFER